MKKFYLIIAAIVFSAVFMVSCGGRGAAPSNAQSSDNASEVTTSCIDKAICDYASIAEKYNELAQKVAAGGGISVVSEMADEFEKIDEIVSLIKDAVKKGTITEEQLTKFKEIDVAGFDPFDDEE